MRHNNSLLTAPLIAELIQQRQRLSRQLQNCQENLKILAAEGDNDSAAEQFSRWNAITDLKTHQITLSSKIELINELLDLGEQAVSDSPPMSQYRS